MADKKMNDFSVASTGEYIYAESASGEQIKISKADLASVVAELLGCAIIKNKKTDLIAGGSTQIPISRGIALVNSTYHSLEYGLFFITNTDIECLGGYNYNDGDAFSFELSNGTLTIQNKGSVAKHFNIIWISL